MFTEHSVEFKNIRGYLNEKFKNIQDFRRPMRTLLYTGIPNSLCTAFTGALALGDNKHIYNLKGFYKFNMR